MIKTCNRCGKEIEVCSGTKYCSDCRDEVKREYLRRYYAAHREKCKANARRWNKENRETALENPDKVEEYNRRACLKRKQRSLNNENYRTVG